jgi:zinc D-Ala-D-Ala dipeptidase
LRVKDRAEPAEFDRRLVALGLFCVALGGCEEAKQPSSAPPKKPLVPVKNDSSLVELASLDPTIRLDIRYATANNFTGRQLYTQPRAFLIKPAAEALVRAHRAARREGFGLTLYDAYRPWRVTKALWDATPPGPKKNYVANPKKGSRHNRGCAVDLTLHHLDSGVQVEMPSGYDEFTARAHRDYRPVADHVLAARDLLEEVMEAEGFRGASNEWWHFDFASWQDYPILDVPFEDLAA